MGQAAVKALLAQRACEPERSKRGSALNCMRVAQFL